MADGVPDGIDTTPPKAAQENAKRALRWRERYGDDVRGGTRVGWIRARQLSKGQPLSRDIVSRMSQFARHMQNMDLSDEHSGTPWRDRGYVAGLLWGGKTGVRWAARKMDEIKRAEE